MKKTFSKNYVTSLASQWKIISRDTFKIQIFISAGPNLRIGNNRFLIFTQKHLGSVDCRSERQKIYSIFIYYIY